MISFDTKLEIGQVAEGAISKWLRARGWSVLPAYEVQRGGYKGPQLYTPSAELIVPDLFVFRGDDARWVEAKHKSAFTHHRISQRWVTGIDLHLYEHYLKVDAKTPWRVWLFFLQRGGQAKDSPPDSPEGLYVGPLSYLKDHSNHTHPNGGTHGMIYWAESELEQLATVEDVLNPADNEIWFGFEW